MSCVLLAGLILSSWDALLTSRPQSLLYSILLCAMVMALYPFWNTPLVSGISVLWFPSLLSTLLSISLLLLFLFPSLIAGSSQHLQRSDLHSPSSTCFLWWAHSLSELLQTVMCTNDFYTSYSEPWPCPRLPFLHLSTVLPVSVPHPVRFSMQSLYPRLPFLFHTLSTFPYPVPLPASICRLYLSVPDVPPNLCFPLRCHWENLSPDQHLQPPPPYNTTTSSAQPNYSFHGVTFLTNKISWLPFPTTSSLNASAQLQAAPNPAPPDLCSFLPSPNMFSFLDIGWLLAGMRKESSPFMLPHVSKCIFSCPKGFSTSYLNSVHRAWQFP